jgi:acyl-CoA reductase-like NAD-dependent aldehyde dehydrogenase
MSTVDIAQQPLLIGGEWTAAQDGGTFERVDPFTGRPVTEAAAGGRVDARRALVAAQAAFGEWSRTPPGQRRALLSAAADLLMERASEIAAVMTEEVGGTFGWGIFNCDLASRMLREAAAQAYAVTGEVIPSDVPGSLAMGVRQPAGVVVGIAPWNAPVILAARAVATPLAYGNTVVLKASERSPRTHAAVARAIADAGLPAGAVNLVIHAARDAPDVVDELIAHPAVRRVNFTGSTRVGRIVAMTCAEHLKRCLLELGGKAPQVVLADADLEAAADAASFGAFMNSGQICMSTERVVADAAVADELGGLLAARASRLVVGDPRERATMIGPVVDDASRERIVDLIADAREKGAQVLAGGEADGNLVAPTVLAGVAAELGLAEPVLPWHVVRLRPAQLAAGLASAAGVLAKVARDVTLLAQDEVGEVREGGAGRGASSAMAHKRNPVAAVSVLACAQRVPGLAATILGAMAHEHERAAGGWQAEWGTLTEMLRLTGSAAAWARDLLEHLEVDAERMRLHAGERPDLGASGVLIDRALAAHHR